MSLAALHDQADAYVRSHEADGVSMYKKGVPATQPKIRRFQTGGQMARKVSGMFPEKSQIVQLVRCEPFNELKLQKFRENYNEIALHSRAAHPSSPNFKLFQLLATGQNGLRNDNNGLKLKKNYYKNIKAEKGHEWAKLDQNKTIGLLQQWLMRPIISEIVASAL